MIVSYLNILSESNWSVPNVAGVPEGPQGRRDLPGLGQHGPHMKIVHLVSYAVLSGPLPGVILLARAQRQAGCAVHIVHDAWRGNFSPYEEIASADPHLASLAAPWPMTLSAKGGPWRALWDISSLRRQITQRGIDVLHCHLSHDHLLGILARPGSTALVRTVHAARAAEPRPGARWLVRHSDGIIARTPAVAEAARRLLGPASPAQVTVVPGAIDAAHWAPSTTSPARRAAWRARLGIPLDAPVLGHVALMAERGQMELLRAFEQVWGRARARQDGPLPHLVFVGRGYQEVPLRWAVGVGDLSRYVHFTGYVAHRRLPGLYAALDGAFVAQPGNDGAARAALEAQAAGVPVIGVAGAPLGGALSPEAAYLAPNRTPEGLAGALEQWLQDPAERRRRGALGAVQMQAGRSPAKEAAATLEVYAWAQRLRRGQPA